MFRDVDPVVVVFTCWGRVLFPLPMFLFAGSIEVMRMDGENNYRRVVRSNTGQADTDVGKPVSICLDPVNG